MLAFVGKEAYRGAFNPRAELGLPAATEHHPGISADLALVATFPQLEYPRRWAPGAELTGPMFFEMPYQDVELPPGDAPLVVVAPSTSKDPELRLVGPGAGSFSYPALVVVFTSLGWAAASLYSRSAPQPAPLLFAAMQMLAGGVLLFAAGALRGELGHLQRPTVSAAEALLYLIVIGSLVGFTAYSWLLRNARMSLIGTYAFVNPVVAVLLGWAFNNESLSLRTLVAGAIIVSGVALIVLAPAYPERRRGTQAAVPVRAR